MKDIRIQSIGDLITNSSTEVFTVINEDTVKDIKNVVETLGGKELLDRFDIVLDPCEQIEDRIDEIIEIMEDNDLTPTPDEDENDYRSYRNYAKRIIATVVDREVIKRHYHLCKDNPFCYTKWDKKKEKYIDIGEVQPLDPETAIEVKDNIFDWLDAINEGHEWQSYPNIVVIPKDKTSKEDEKIAKIIEHLPFIADHTASYC